jgi:hypothetical protein
MSQKTSLCVCASSLIADTVKPKLFLLVTQERPYICSPLEYLEEYIIFPLFLAVSGLSNLLLWPQATPLNHKH